MVAAEVNGIRLGKRSSVVLGLGKATAGCCTPSVVLTAVNPEMLVTAAFVVQSVMVMLKVPVVLFVFPSKTWAPVFASKSLLKSVSVTILIGICFLAVLAAVLASG